MALLGEKSEGTEDDKAKQEMKVAFGLFDKENKGLAIHNDFLGCESGGSP